MVENEVKSESSRCWWVGVELKRNMIEQARRRTPQFFMHRFECKRPVPTETDINTLTESSH